MSWNRRIKHPSEVLKKGDTVQARVVNVDAENQRLSLSVREFLPNDWDEFAKTHHIGDEVVGIVSKITDFGLFVRLADGVEALAHISEIPREGKTKLDRIYQPGDPIRARIIKIEPGERKIGLTTRDVTPLTDEERAEYAGGAHHETETHAEEHHEAEAPSHDEAAPETKTQS